MDKIGFIGYGSIGEMIVNGFISSNKIKPSDMIVSTRKIDKLDELKIKYPEIEIVANKKLLTNKCSKIFLMVNTNELINVLEEIKSDLSLDAHIIYTSAGIGIEQLETIFSGKITHIIPTLTGKVAKGVNLISHNKKVDNQDVNFINNTFKSLGQTKIIPEKDMALATIITSCFPAFVAFFCKKFAEQAVLDGNFSQKEVDEMIKATLEGTSLLLLKMDFDDVISRIATKKGITEAGLKIMDEKLPELLKELFGVTSH
ncbi:MAG: pyrroline-5-carboxylate reductase dimerization domain-containing protein [Methanobacteriaceae archaeon]|nr:pyrroline-5-carboxylate reductase dimerization domain-containing protein [Methanobacteriaceae archaeon]